MKTTISDITPPHPRALASFVRSIAVLALPAVDQHLWMDRALSFASWNVDELALEFDAGNLLVGQWVTAGWLPAASLPALQTLDRALHDMSGEEFESLWTRDALVTAAEWSHVRLLGAAVLDTL
jgi:hypothetical protein